MSAYNPIRIVDLSRLGSFALLGPVRDLLSNWYVMVGDVVADLSQLIIRRQITRWGRLAACLGYLTLLL